MAACGVTVLGALRDAEQVRRASDADGSPVGRDPVVDLLGRPAAVLAVEILDDGATRAAATETRRAQLVECPETPAVHV